LLYLADKIPDYFQTFISIVDTFIYTKIIPLYQKIVSLFYLLTPTHQETIIDHIQPLNNYIGTTRASLIQNYFIQIPVLMFFLPYAVSVVTLYNLATLSTPKEREIIRDKT